MFYFSQNTFLHENIVYDIDTEPRDSFDLWYLLQQKLNITVIYDEYKKKYGYNIIVPNLISQINKEDYRNNWKNRLSYQMSDLPDFDLVHQNLIQLIKRKLKSNR